LKWQHFLLNFIINFGDYKKEKGMHTHSIPCVAAAEPQGHPTALICRSLSDRLSVRLSRVISLIGFDFTIALMVWNI
jgi:hypothetical protein